eukprot:scaffold90767_cov63-Cyclotella_meneghiniana.AAC.1
MANRVLEQHQQGHMEQSIGAELSRTLLRLRLPLAFGIVLTFLSFTSHVSRSNTFLGMTVCDGYTLKLLLPSSRSRVYDFLSKNISKSTTVCDGYTLKLLIPSSRSRVYDFLSKNISKSTTVVRSNFRCRPQVEGEQTMN